MPRHDTGIPTGRWRRQNGSRDAQHRRRRRCGRLSVHCRTGTGGNKWSTKCAARSAMRRPPQLGQNPRPLHENGTSRFRPQSSHRTRANPRASTPHPRNSRNSCSTNRGRPRPSRARAAAARKASRQIQDDSIEGRVRGLPRLVAGGWMRHAIGPSRVACQAKDPVKSGSNARSSENGGSSCARRASSRWQVLQERVPPAALSRTPRPCGIIRGGARMRGKGPRLDVEFDGHA